MTPASADPPAIRIAPLRMEEIPEVAEIENLSFPTPWSLSSFRHEMTENPYATLFGVRLVRGPLVGFGCVWAIDQELKINNLAVHPRWRGHRIGSRLLQALLEFGTGEGCVEATLEVRPSNTPALKMYTRAGFRIIGRRRGYYSDTHEDALVMSCPLTPKTGPPRLAGPDPGC
jgi:[ribosomal protein S18]-alanine N-acetyltransferase